MVTITLLIISPILPLRISGSTVLSKLDLHKDYYQVPMNEDDIQKTAIIMQFGMCEFLPLPFGLRNALSRE